MPHAQTLQKYGNTNITEMRTEMDRRGKLTLWRKFSQHNLLSSYWNGVFAESAIVRDIFFLLRAEKYLWERKREDKVLFRSSRKTSPEGVADIFRRRQCHNSLVKHQRLPHQSSREYQLPRGTGNKQSGNVKSKPRHAYYILWWLTEHTDDDDSVSHDDDGDDVAFHDRERGPPEGRR